MRGRIFICFTFKWEFMGEVIFLDECLHLVVISFLLIYIV